ncbi:hypothetical protein Tco_1100216 [Tanacetum coccineum]
MYKSDEIAVDIVLEVLADLANPKNASADKPSLSDPLCHLQTEVSFLTTKVEQLESLLAKKVADKLEESVPDNIKYLIVFGGKIPLILHVVGIKRLLDDLRVIAVKVLVTAAKHKLVMQEAEITLVDETHGRYGDEDMFGVNDLDGDEVVVESEVTDKACEKRNIIKEAVAVTDAVTIPVSAATITNVELTLAQTLAELKSARPNTKGVKGQCSKDKGKAKMIEPEKPLKKKDQIKFDEEEALRLQAKFDEEDRLAREKAQQVKEANIAWDDIQAKIDVDYQLAERLQAQEQQELTIEEKSTLFVQLLEKRKKHFAAKRAEEKRIDHLQELNK